MVNLFKTKSPLMEFQLQLQGETLMVYERGLKNILQNHGAFVGL